ncbi:unnamed protein product [Amoebophrya sp. A120]|nr:unnamed protein product [Amoebophrya sp. A120]|eukprot:GSA120T00016692001.1
MGKNQDQYDAYTKLELDGLSGELKDWFLSRRIEMERGLSIKKALDEKNFTGLSLNNSALPPTQRVIWGDLVFGKPVLESGLSQSAKVMKAEMYLKTFRDATDMDHLCRIPGSAYLRCLRDTAVSGEASDSKCTDAFAAFDTCRKGLIARQDEALQKSIMKQDIADHRAKAIFERRSILLDTVTA